MFTGIIEETGSVLAVSPRDAGSRITISAQTVLSDLEIGGSIAVNGCCLTAIAITTDSFAADLSPETLSLTNLDSLRPGDRVNLERALLPTSRLSGHFVQGHVDGQGELVECAELGADAWRLVVRAPENLHQYLVYKGSIAVDGISLTIAKLAGDRVEIAIIPHTYHETNLSSRKPGDRVNLECDVIAKHVARLFELTRNSGDAPAEAK